jgi:1,4-alpha-glucan branching enzyme
MIKRTSHGRDGPVTVAFTICSDGHELPVRLIGAFNDWDTEGIPLEPVAETHLTATLDLPAGQRFAFRCRDAHGRWFNDESADGYCANEWGGMNSVVQT